jgi:RNA polymerase sigma-70 factor (ECF subfamily)
MNKSDYLTARFEEHRTHLRAVAYRMLGSVSDVDDAVQEAWLRLNRADTAGIDNGPGGPVRRAGRGPRRGGVGRGPSPMGTWRGSSGPPS